MTGVGGGAALLLAACAAVTAACSGAPAHPPACDPAPTPVAVHRQALPTAHGHLWNVAVVVNNVAREQRRIRVGLAGHPAVDVTLPAACGGITSPMTELHFRLPAGRTPLTATSSNRTHTTAAFAVPHDARVWVLVTDNEPRRLGLTVGTYPHRPLFG